MQRFTSLLLLPFSGWLLFALKHISGGGLSHGELLVWLAKPLNGYGLLGFVVLMAYHTYLCLFEVLKDYVSCGCKFKILVFLLKLSSIGVVAVVGYIIWQVSQFSGM